MELGYLERVNKYNIPISNDNYSYSPNEIYIKRYYSKEIFARYINEMSFGIHIIVRY
jgi:hypothetical protein